MLISIFRSRLREENAGGFSELRYYEAYTLRVTDPVRETRFER
jgi:hypothetical protein